MHGDSKALLPRLRLACLMLAGLLLTACSDARPDKIRTIGVLNYVAHLEPVIEGFKIRMAELGYAEGKNVTYLYHGVLKPEPQIIEREVQRIMAHQVDLFLTLGNQPTLVAKKASSGRAIPVVFAPAINPVGEGFVASIKHPGGNVTGVQSVNGAPKALEWLLKLAPGTQTVYVPYRSDDPVAVWTVKPLLDAAAQLKVNLVLSEIRAPEDMATVLQSLPKHAAVFFTPAPSLEASILAAQELAITLGVPTGGYNRPVDNLLCTYTTDRRAQGAQAARLADQIFKGTKPADLPVEAGEFFFRINLKTAAAIGLDVPDDLLHQADTVMRK